VDSLTLIGIVLLALMLLVLYQYRHSLPFHSSRWRGTSLNQRMDGPSQPTVDRLCPNCGDVMADGCLVASEGVYWSKTLPPTSLIRPFLGAQLIGEPLAFHLPYPIGAAILRASRCRRCGVILVDMGRQDFTAM
jgi:hypothetical protein